MELLLAMKEPFVCHFLRGTYIKNDHPLLFRLACSPPVCAPLESGSAGGSEQRGRNGTGSRTRSALTQEPISGPHVLTPS